MERRRGRLGDHRDPLLRDLEHVLDLLGDRVGRDDHARCALDREVAQLEAEHRAEVLAVVLERCQVVQRHDHRDRAPKQGAVEPRGVEHLAAARLVGLDELALTDLEQRLEQALGITSNTVGALRGAAVECDFHERRPDDAR